MNNSAAETAIKQERCCKQAGVFAVSLKETALELKQQSGKDILVGSRSLIMQLMKLNLIDEFQLCIYPVVAGNGVPLFEKVKDRTIFKLIKTKTFKSGAVILYYEQRMGDNQGSR